MGRPARTRVNGTGKSIVAGNAVDKQGPVSIVSGANELEQALEIVIKNPDTPAAAKVQAIRTLAEMRGLIGRNSKPQDPDADPYVMSRAELERALKRGV